MSRERVSGFPEKGADSWEVRETSGEVPENFRGSPKELPGNLWMAVKFHSERTSGEVAGELSGKSGELLGEVLNFPEAQGSPTPSQRLAKFVSTWVVVDSFALSVL